MKVVWWKMKDLSCWGVLLPDGWTDRWTDICECRVAFATDKIGFRLVELKFSKMSIYWKFCKSTLYFFVPKVLKKPDMGQKVQPKI